MTASQGSRRGTRVAVAIILFFTPYAAFLAIQLTTPVDPIWFKIGGTNAQTVVQPIAGRTITVSPTGHGDSSSIASAVSAAEPGDTVLVGPGTYHEEVNVTKPWITIRGEDARRVILDGNFTLKVGVTADSAPGISVEDLTTKNYLYDGIFFVKSDHWLMDHIIATNNRGYGLYTLASRWGVMKDSIATGGGDSGFYIGETHNCNCVIENSTAYGNVVGYSGTRVDGVVIRNSTFIENAVGVAPNTLLPVISLALTGRWSPPFFASNHTIEDNVIVDNNNRTVLGVGISASYGVPIGTGISLAGTFGNTIRDNIIAGNTRWGIAEWYFFGAPIGNTFESNNFGRNGQDFWTDGTTFSGCSSRETATGDVPPTCSLPPYLRVMVPNPVKEIDLILNLGRPGYVTEAILAPQLFLAVTLAIGQRGIGESTPRLGELEAASRRHRVLSALLDGLFVGIVYIAVSSLLVSSFGVTDFQSLVNNVFAFSLLLVPLAYFLFITIWFLYSVVSDLAGRRTIGKFLMDLEVVSGRGARPSASRLLAKNLLAYLGALSFGLVWLVFVLSQRRSLSERLTGTYVVRRRQL